MDLPEVADALVSEVIGLSGVKKVPVRRMAAILAHLFPEIPPTEVTRSVDLAVKRSLLAHTPKEVGRLNGAGER